MKNRKQSTISTTLAQIYTVLVTSVMIAELAPEFVAELARKTNNNLTKDRKKLLKNIDKLLSSENPIDTEIATYVMRLHKLEKDEIARIRKILKQVEKEARKLGMQFRTIRTELESRSEDFRKFIVDRS